MMHLLLLTDNLQGHCPCQITAIYCTISVAHTFGVFEQQGLAVFVLDTHVNTGWLCICPDPE